MDFKEVMENIAKAFEAVGVAVIVIGGVHAMVQAFFERNERGYYSRARTLFGKPLILGLEILVAADIIKTITVETTLESVAALGILVLVRVILSFSLDIEVDGRAPWRRARAEQVTAIRD
jgi:uncharacterized membrane protein